MGAFERRRLFSFWGVVTIFPERCKHRKTRLELSIGVTSEDPQAWRFKNLEVALGHESLGEGVHEDHHRTKFRRKTNNGRERQREGVAPILVSRHRDFLPGE